MDDDGAATPAQELAARLCRAARHDGSATVRCEATRALGALAREVPRLVDELEAILDDPSDAVRRAAVVALGATRDDRARLVLVDVLRARPELWREASAALVELCADAVCDDLVRLLEAEDARTRCGAARALGGLARARLDAPGVPLNGYEDEAGVLHALC